LLPSIIVPLLKVNHVFLVPLIILGLPSVVLFQQGLLIIPILVVVGLAGMLTRNSVAALMTSVSLLGLIVWGRIASDLWGLTGIDTALLLLEFMLVILLMEASSAVISFDTINKRLEGKNDNASVESRARLTEWLGAQLASLGKLIATAFALSLGLLVIGDLVSVSVNQFAFSGALVLLAVVALLILLTYRREPEDRKRRNALFQHSHTS
jgi:hypothetical protein